MKHLGWKLILLIILAFLVFLWLVKSPFLSSYLTAKLRVPVSIQHISVWPSSASLYNFRIKNPDGFKAEYALTAESTEIDYQLSQLFGNPLVIDQILIDNIFLGIECSDGSCSENNWTAIGERMPKEKSNQEVIIHKLVLTNLTAEISGLQALGGKKLTRRVERLEFDEIDSKKGFPTEELVRRLFQGAGLQQYLKNLFNPQKIIEQYLSPLKIFGNEKGPEKPEPLNLDSETGS